ncbi:alpha/beta fold hydrolase [Mesorhizobium sp. DCY119]|uniref:alpha/beta fold hydrolase n=1 Tax=Mesorhizobium sp. DCY119 TaxID=2108445 RepID=UPI000E717066|nr:alpha/beta fold hydrolase [Mesorhizobium sp. DCY119]RJG40592.1 alpha/beta fold hydrolase [Mesorhizobium sp. DCY119]
MSSAFRHSYQRIARVDVGLWRGGSGDPLLFLHGSHGLAAPLPFLEDLARHYAVLAPEHPGFGRSAAPDWHGDVDDFTYFYLDLLEALAPRPVHVVGQSIGGWIAIEVAIKCQDRIRSLVMSGSPGLSVAGAAVADVFSLSDDKLITLLYADPVLAEAARRRGSSPWAAKNAVALHRLAYACRFIDPRLEGRLHRIKRPTLALWGAEDQIVPPDFGKAYCASIAGARFETIPGAAHLPHAERPELYVGAIRAFHQGI